MAKFPLNEARCRQWVKITGKEDLAYVPIEKLYQLKNICGNHFRPKDFKKKRTQLRKSAVPCTGIPAKPLSDEVLRDFPLHIDKHVAEPQCSNDPLALTLETEPAIKKKRSCSPKPSTSTESDVVVAAHSAVTLETEPAIKKKRSCSQKPSTSTESDVVVAAPSALTLETEPAIKKKRSCSQKPSTSTESDVVVAAPSALTLETEPAIKKKRSCSQKPSTSTESDVVVADPSALTLEIKSAIKRKRSCSPR